MGKPVKEFLHVLARTLGRTVHELEQTISYTEFLDWWELYAHRPWDETRSDIQAALICTTIANQYRSKPAKIHDFLLFKDEEVPPPAEARPVESAGPGRAVVSSEVVTNLMILAALTEDEQRKAH